MLEVIDLGPWLSALGWLLVGGESGIGNRSRPMHPEWARQLRDQAQARGVAVFMKQVGSNGARWSGVRHRRGEDPREWPADLRVRDFPKQAEPRRQKLAFDAY